MITILDILMLASTLFSLFIDLNATLIAMFQEKVDRRDKIRILVPQKHERLEIVPIGTDFQ